MAVSTRQWLACWRRGRWRALALVGAALCALCVRAPAQRSAVHHLPALAPAAVAHSLADFSNQPDMYVRHAPLRQPEPDNNTSWSVEEDHSNYTTWRYSVSFWYGTWYQGRGVVVAGDEPAGTAPQHGRAARAHHVSLVRRDCFALPLVPWPQLCDEVEVRSVVSRAGDGAQLQWAARTSCGVLGWASGACAHRLQRHHQHVLQRLLHAAPRAS